jgi:hypothetical protein
MVFVYIFFPSCFDSVLLSTTLLFRCWDFKIHFLNVFSLFIYFIFSIWFEIFWFQTISMSLFISSHFLSVQSLFLLKHLFTIILIRRNTSKLTYLVLPESLFKNLLLLLYLMQYLWNVFCVFIFFSYPQLITCFQIALIMPNITLHMSNIKPNMFLRSTMQ